MYIKTENDVAGGLPVWNSLLDVRQGGGLLGVARIPSATKFIKAGTMVQESASTANVYQIIKRSASARAKTTVTTLMPYAKNDLFKVGEFVAKYGAPTTQSTITRISQSTNTTWVATSTALGAFATTTVIVEVAAAAITTGALLYTPQFAIAEDLRVRFDDLETVPNPIFSVAINGSLIESALPYAVSTADKTSLQGKFNFV